ncbi:S-layer homology domain-containing protein [Flavonifractor plautii]|uniref:S-layer homology domain-containing protein n=1 Tax=Flavonifractor plautii TaxID=292800 RepID=UPI001D717ACF|nr:S-layer homology domain-containing protein [Flavonifractor plautii]MBM6665676.1 S-layer homology domain-containing protein [Flavonifractor plautii]
MRKLSLFFLTLCLTVTALISGAAAAQGLRLVVSSREAAATQTVGFSGLPADCQSLQATFALSNQEASYGFVADQDLAGRTGLYVTAKHSDASVTVYVTAKSGVLSDDGSLTLGTISSSDGLSTFTVEQATGLKLIASDNTETTYPSVDTGDSTGGGSGGSGGGSSSGGSGGGSNSGGSDNSGNSGGDKEDAGLPFTDVASGSWYYDSVAYVYEQGLMGGTGEGRFSPDLTTSRAMIVTILYRLEGSPAVSGGASFADVTAGQWYSDGVAWASANGIVTGYSNGSFGPDDTITREQMAAILYRHARYKGYDLSAQAALDGYADAAQVSAYAADAMKWAVGSGLITGTSGTTLSPAGSATRAQAAVILARFCQTLAQ